MDVPNKKRANLIFYFLLVSQIVGVSLLVRMYQSDIHGAGRDVLLFVVCFTGVPVWAVLLVTMLEKIPSPRRKGVGK